MDLSIKDAEHKKRSALFIGGSKNVFSSSIDTIPLARKFSSFFANSENKITLHEFLLKILPRSTRKISTLKKNVFPVFRFQQKTDTFFCHQEGTDTRIFYHAKILDQSLDIDTTVDAEDANVIIIAAYVSTTLQKKMI